MAIQGLSMFTSETDSTKHGIRYAENGVEKFIEPTLTLVEAMEAIGNLATTGRVFKTDCYIMRDGVKIAVDVQRHERTYSEYFVRPVCEPKGTWTLAKESDIIFEEVPLA